MQQDPSKYPSLVLHPAFCKEFDSNEVRIWAGHRKSKAFIQCEGWDYTPQVNVSRQLSQHLYLPSGNYNIYHSNPNEIRLGPVVGVLSCYPHRSVLPSGKKARIFKELFDLSRRKGLFIYRFFPEDVDTKRKTIHGHTFNQHGRFYRSTFPMPDVVYNRIRYRDIERREDVKRLLHYFHNEPGIYLFNSRFLNKIEVYRALMQDAECAALLPETAILSANSLKYFLGKYGEVYIKPIANSLGKGIVKVKKHSHADYKVQFANSTRKSSLANVAQVYLHLKQSGIRPSKYLVQKGIDLAMFQGRVFDLRAQVQKDRKGEWILTGVGVRVAGANRIVTHIPNGGTAKAYDSVIDHVFRHNPATRAAIDTQLELMAQQIPRALNRKLPIELALLSMDIGLDKQGKLWLIEVNSKPSYFDEHHIRAIHTQTLVDYFIFSASNNLGGRE